MRLVRDFLAAAALLCVAVSAHASLPAHVISVAGSPNVHTYDVGEYIYVFVTFSEPVHVTGSGRLPFVVITVGSTPRDAQMIDDPSDSVAMHTFRYQVENGEVDSDGITINSLDAGAYVFQGGTT